MLAKTLISLFVLIYGVCEGFDFTFQSTVLNVTSDSAAATHGCGVMKCSHSHSQLMPADPADTDSDTRTILSLAVYRRNSGAGLDTQWWEELARVTSRSPSEHKASDARHTTGTLSDTRAQLTVALLKAGDCEHPEFSCVAELVDSRGQKSKMQSVIRGHLGSTEHLNSNVEPQVGEDQSGTVRNVENFMAMLTEKLKCIETRLGDAQNRDDRLESKLEGLKEKLSNLELTVSRDIDRSSDRMEDKMERVKDRLEDKLSQVSAGLPLRRVESESETNVCPNIFSQIASVESSVESVDRSLNSLADQVRGIEVSMPRTTALDDKLDKIAAGVTGLSIVTNNLTGSVDRALTSSCADETSVPVDEFFDVLGTGNRDWRLAFRGTAYNNVEIYPAYIHGTGIPARVEVGCKQFNNSLPCVNHYRNKDALENWTNVDEVLLALYAKGQMVKRILFNGRGSTFTSWFEGQRVLQSSWNDLKTRSHNIFSIEGDIRITLLRRFIANHEYLGCPRDRGWLIVGDALPGVCPWEAKLARPAFIYAKGSTVALWSSSQDVARADAMGIFIKYQ